MTENPMTEKSPADISAQIQEGFSLAPIPLLILEYRYILECNDEMCRLFGFSREMMLGKSIRMLYPSNFDFKIIGEKWLDKFQQSSNHEDERFMQARGGNIFLARVRGRTLTSHKPFERTVWTFEHIASEQSGTSTLTPREREIARLIVNGSTCKVIGKLLGISYRTAEAHRATILKKMKAKNTAELVSKIILIDTDLHHQETSEQPAFE